MNEGVCGLMWAFLSVYICYWFGIYAIKLDIFEARNK